MPLDLEQILAIDKARINGEPPETIHEALEAAGLDADSAFKEYASTRFADGRLRAEVNLGDPQEWGIPLTPSKTRPTHVSGVRKKKGAPIYVGDSLGVGTSPSFKRAKKSVEVGRRSDEAASELRRLDDGSSPIVFDAGTNDASAGDLKRNLKRVMKEAGGRPVYVMEIQGGPDAKAKNRVLRRSGATMVDTSAAGVTSDGIHAGNYKRRAKLLKRAMKNR